MSLQIIRISDGTYSVGEKCFFPSNGIEHDKLMPRVNKDVYTSGKSEQQQKKTKEFLEAVGVREVGEAEEVEMILRARYSQEAADHKSFKPEIKEIERFIALVEKEPSQASLFKDHYIFKLTNGKWGKPCQVYLDSPFFETGLYIYYDSLGDETAPEALSPTYNECGTERVKLVKFAKAVGVNTKLQLLKLHVMITQTGII